MAVSRFTWNLSDLKIEYRNEKDKHKISQIDGILEELLKRLQEDEQEMTERN